jgi:AraC-like DNA-binding protein
MALYEQKPTGDIQKEYKTNMGYACHLHPSLELCFVLEGEAVCLLNGQHFVAKKGDALMLFPYQIHEFPFDLNHKGRFALLNVPANIYGPYRSFIAEYLPVTPLLCGVVAQEEIKALLEIIIAAENSGIPKQMASSFTVGLLGALLQTAELTHRSAKQENLLLDVLEYCSGHYKEKLSLGELAKTFYVNQSSLSRLFNHLLGISFNDFLHLLRLEEAEELLCTTSKSVSEIAFEVGFSNVRSFHRACEKHRGLSPTAIRQKSHQVHYGG